MKLLKTKIPTMISGHLYDFCQSTKFSLCQDAEFLESVCPLFPFMIMKTVRLGLDIVEPMFRDDNFQLLFLVRDPRGVLNSRKHTVNWCKNQYLCIDAKLHCNQIERDLNETLRLSQIYPNRVHLLRYEDLALNPQEKAEELFEQLGLSMTKEVNDFIQSHTQNEKKNAWSIHRKQGERVMIWAKQFNFQEVSDIQSNCVHLMNSLGYLPVKSIKNLSISNVLSTNF